MDIRRQSRAPFVEALEAYRSLHMVPFHTPGHKLGTGASAYQQQLFHGALPLDLGVMYALDDLFQPTGCLKEAMELAADLYGAGRSFFSVNGTTACIQAMLLAVTGPGDTVILARESHRSVLGGLTLSGAMPAYLPGTFAEKEQVALGPDLEGLRRTIDNHPEAKVIVLTYPTYDGIAIPLRQMVSYAHERGLLVLVDEAHGAHLPFSDALPEPALDCGADCVAQSTHKLTGSLTQTSMLHCRKGFPYVDRVAAAMALVQSTSPNYLLLASLDSARRQLAVEGRQLIGQAVVLARKLRQDINDIPGLYSFGREILRYPNVQGLDETKITIDFSSLGLDGREAEVLLRRQGMEVELVAGNHVLALITLGDTECSTAALLQACRQISSDHERVSRPGVSEPALPVPVPVVSPKTAWSAAKESIALEQCCGQIAGETITFYPPGIPVIGAGERITAECIEYIMQKRAGGYDVHGAADPSLQTIVVLNHREGV
jgi:arginine decarboxylase